MVDPSRIVPDTKPPGTVIERVQVDDRTVVPAGTIEVPPETKRIVFAYTGLSGEAPEHVACFRYQLDGFDQRWTDAGTTRSASYMGLGPGAYKFRVMAANRYGLWEEATPVRLLITQPFYRTNWFMAIVPERRLLADASLIYRSGEFASSVLPVNRAALKERARMAHAKSMTTSFKVWRVHRWCWRRSRTLCLRGGQRCS